jgi:hypothetical protein
LLNHNFEKKQNLKQYQYYKAALCLLLLIVLLFLSSCDINRGTQSATTNYYVGTGGLEFKFLDQAPQAEVYENSRFVVGFMVENAGASDVTEMNYGILSIGFDPFYIDASELTSASDVQGGSNSIVFSGIQLVGRSQLNPSGSSTFISFPGFKTRPIMGQIESPSTQLLASLCYPYTTIFSGVVCVDHSLVGQDLRQQVCYQKTLDLSDQGAPVAITRIDVENQPVTSGGESVAVRPVFTIYVQNKGTGSVLSPVVGSANLDRVCSFQDITRQDFNTVNIEAVLSASTSLTCTPNPIKLINDEGISRCEVNDEDLIIGSHNYETPLNVKLSYVYQSAISKKIDIKRLNVYGTPSAPSTGCLDFEVASGGGCVNRCDACANGTGAGCQPPDDPNHPGHSINFQKGFACQCSRQICGDLYYPKGLCVPYSGWCPGVSYCCLPPCPSDKPIRLSDGICYPRCNKCTVAGLGKDPAPKDCACGAGTDAIAYILVNKGGYCCNLLNLTRPFSDLQSCTNTCTTIIPRASAGTS